MLGSKFALAASLLVAVASAHEGEEHSSGSAAVSGSVGSTHEEHEQSSASGVSGSVGATEVCSADVSASFIATIDNSTYFETCAEGTTFNITSVFDVLNFTDSEFLAFCNSSTCLEPLHELMEPLDCLITYEGTARDLSSEVSKLHDECHEVLDAADLDMGAQNSASGSTASGSSDASSVVMTVGSVVSAIVLAAFLA